MSRKLAVLFAGLCVSLTTAARYTPPRLPWGDPDLQGTYTNKYELNTPFERPKEFEGRRVDDVTGAELADVVRRRQAEAAYRPDGPQAFTPFRDVFEIAKGSRPWLVVDPPDGRIPPLRPDARDRATPADASIYAVNERWPVTGSIAGGPFESPEDFSLYDRCITRGLPGAMVPHVQGNSYEIVQAPGVIAIRYELMHETRIVPLDRASHVGAAIRLEMGDARGHWEHDTLVVETRNFNERSTIATRGPRHSVSSSASPARRPTESNGPSRSTIPPRGRSRGRSWFR